MRISLCLCATSVTQFWDRSLDFRRLWKKEKKKKDVEDLYYFYLDKSYLSLNK